MSSHGTPVKGPSGSPRAISARASRARIARTATTANTAAKSRLKAIIQWVPSASSPTSDTSPARNSRQPPIAADSPDFVQRVTARIIAGQGDWLPVSALPVDGTFATGTARFLVIDLNRESQRHFSSFAPSFDHGDAAVLAVQHWLQGARLAGLLRDKRMKHHSLVAVFEGNDAAGKGGAIRRVAAALDPRQYRIVPIAAPSEDERAQPYLWRFWRQIPARGMFTVFDRSWYGRVLVERIEGFCVTPKYQVHDSVELSGSAFVSAC